MATVSAETPIKTCITDLIAECDDLKEKNNRYLTCIKELDQRVNDLFIHEQDALFKLVHMEHHAIAAEAAHESANELLVKAEMERDTLRDEALGWHKRCDELERPLLPGGIRILIETTDPSVGQWLEDLVLERIGLRRKVEEQDRAIARLTARLLEYGVSPVNPCVSPED